MSWPATLSIRPDVREPGGNCYVSDVDSAATPRHNLIMSFGAHLRLFDEIASLKELLQKAKAAFQHQILHSEID